MNEKMADTRSKKAENRLKKKTSLNSGIDNSGKHSDTDNELARKFYTAVGEMTDSGIIGVSSDNKIWLWNSSAEKIFGIPKSEVINRPIRWLFDPRKDSVYKEFINAIKNISDVREYELWYELKGRGKIYLSARMFPVLLTDGEYSSVAIILRDITAHKLAEERLKASEAFYHSLVETLPQNIFRKDLNERFTFANSRFCQTLGVPLSEIIGKTDFDFYPAELAKKYQQDDQYVIRTGKTLETVEENQPPGGGKIYVQVCKTPIRDADGKIIGIQGIFWDITEQKLDKDRLVKANEELERSKQELLKALTELEKSHEELKAAQSLLIQAEKLESVGRLAAGVAHEVKNPLAIIQSGLDYLTQPGVVQDENAVQVLKDMKEALARADSVIRGMLDFAASQELGLHPENLNTIIESAISLLKYDLTRNRIKVVKELSPDMPGVLADRTRIEQVFVNLIINAMHAMPEGGTLTLRTYSEEFKVSDYKGDSPSWGRRFFRPGDIVVVAEVDDTGSGIPPEIMPKLFEPFCTTKKSSKGTGLGLAVSRKIMEIHGGSIEIFNRKEGGARARLMFRAKQD